MIILNSLESQLRDLKVAFDDAFTKGVSFNEVKKIYLEIKQVEQLIAERQRKLSNHI